MALNQSNFGIANGRLGRDVVKFENSDGSKKVLVTLMVDDNFTSRDGQRKSQAIQLEAFVTAGTEGLGVYDHIHRGDAVSLQYHVVSDNYTKANGEAVYSQKLVIDGVEFRETKAVTTARLEARKVAEAAEAAGVNVVGSPAPAPGQVDPADSPFSA